jgi:hypothetical protein
MGPMPMIIKTIVAVADAVDKILSGNNNHAKRDATDSRAPFLADLLVSRLYIQARFSLAFTRLLRLEYC